MSSPVEPDATMGERIGRLQSAARALPEPWAVERVSVELPYLLDLLVRMFYGSPAARQPGADAELVELRKSLAEGTASDGYHTHRELYEYRMLYNAHAAHGWLAAGIPVVKSWRHSDGELCFGGGWFIVTAQLPTGQVSNHYRASHWNLFNVPEVRLPPEYDGHTPADAAHRLRAALSAPAGPGADAARLAEYEDTERRAAWTEAVLTEEERRRLHDAFPESLA